jgi:exopolyphosphatase/pppGpp-phosphohydrolase
MRVFLWTPPDFRALNINACDEICHDNLHINQQKHQNYHFIVMLGQTLLHVSAYHRHRQGAHIILTSCLYVGVHYRKNNGISSEVAAISIVTLWI